MTRRSERVKEMMQHPWKPRIWNAEACENKQKQERKRMGKTERHPVKPKMPTKHQEWNAGA